MKVAAGNTAALPELIAVSKNASIEDIEEYIKLGITAFGENKLQEAANKWPELKAKYPHIKLHFIGNLQTNKAAQVASLFHCIQSVDREKLVDALKEENFKGDIYIQVNIGEELQKGGVMPSNALSLAEYAQAAGLNVRGLMCIPPAEVEPSPFFALLAKLAAEAGVAGLSMGMSGDYEKAIRMGATSIRVGSALFAGGISTLTNS